MANVATIDLDWEPDPSDPDDSLKFDVYVVVSSSGYFWGRSFRWTSDQSQAKHYFSKEKAEHLVRYWASDQSLGPEAPDEVGPVAPLLPGCKGYGKARVIKL